VSGNKGHVVAKRKELVADAGNQLLVVATGKIGPADGPFEQDVADPGQSLPGMVENHVSGSVAGTMQNPQFQFTDGNRVAVDQPAIGGKRLNGGHPRHAAPFGQLLQPEGIAAMRALNRNSQLPPKQVRSRAMIHVGMRQDHLFD